jgi:hypothetical protein
VTVDNLDGREALGLADSGATAVRPATQDSTTALGGRATTPPEPRVRITASVDYTLSVPASWVGPDSEYHDDPDEAVFTWIVDNADSCIAEADLADFSVWLPQNQTDGVS